jgi:pyruvate/2-oxoglutarate dehydrogenase complex dihydrolipoamide acyltransferase (E2) component
MAESEPSPARDEDEAAVTRAGLGDLLGALMGGAHGGGASTPAAGIDLGGIQGLLGGGGGLPGLPDDEPDEPSSGGGAPDGVGGLDLGALLGSLMAGSQEQSTVAPQGGGLDLGALLGGLMGGAQGQSGAPAQGGLSSSLLQAALPLVMGALFKGSGGGRAPGVRAGSVSDPQTDAAVEDMAALLQETRTSGVPPAAALRSSPAALHLANEAGIDVAAAVQALQQLLAALQGKPAKAKAKPRPKPSASTSKPKPKPKPASATSKPKPSGAAKPKPRPAAKPSGSTKPKTSSKRPAGGNKRSTGGG